jgi:glyoxylase-like metal-dependent hydrolase (beta-lactamase superfamily II)
VLEHDLCAGALRLRACGDLGSLSNWITSPNIRSRHRPSRIQAVSDDPERQRLGVRGIVRLRADNPGPLTLSGTNTWVAGRDPAFVIDPGPALDAHIEAIVAALDGRGGLGGVALTHGHGDHTEAVAALRARFDAPVAAAAGRDVALAEGDSFGPLRAVATPGHAPDHLAYLFDGACFTGDAVLGEGSVFIAPDPGAMRGYLAGLQRLRELGLDVLCPGHGPPVWDADAKLDQYIAHRLDRERRLVAALEQGLRRTDELLDAAWSDVPAALRPAAAVTLAAHLDKLEEEGRLPAAVERPRLR